MRLIIVALAALAFAAPAWAGAGTTYNDGTGENPAEADISTVVVSNDPSLQTISMQVTITNMPTMEANAAVVVLFDTDQNRSTGNPDGFEYAFTTDSGGYSWSLWNGTAFVDAPGNLGVTYVNGVLSVTIPYAAIGGSLAGFNFGVASLRGPDPNNPVVDQTTLWTYTLTAAPATPPATAPAAPATVSSTTAVFQGVPTSGKPFVVKGLTVDLSTGVETKARSIACTATLNGKAVKGTGGGHCTFALPKTAKGQHLSLHVTGVYGKTKLAKTYVFRVR